MPPRTIRAVCDVGAALGSTGDYLERAKELVAKKVDVLVIDTAHGHSERVMNAVAASEASSCPMCS